jgi:serine protease Do
MNYESGMKEVTMKRLIMMVFIILLLFFAVGMSLHLEAADNIRKFEAEIKGILDTVSPSIVKVVAENHKKYVATGIAVERSLVVSNMAVIQSQYADIYIETVDGNKFPARVIGKDRDSSLILLKLEKDSLTPIGGAKAYDVGDWIAEVGVFYKEFPAIYQGMISSKSDDELILNVPVVPGSAGGAVVNKKGELVGVIRGRFGFSFSPDYTYKDHSAEIHIQGFRNKNENLCYAVPWEKVKEITEDLKKYGKVRRGWLGVMLTEGKRGVKITYVTKDSPADKAGIRKNDEILKFNGSVIREPGQVSRIVKALKPDQKVKIDILRGDKRDSVVAVIGEAGPGVALWTSRGIPGIDIEGVELPEFSESIPKLENYVFRFGGARSLGVDVIALTPELAREFNIKGGTGLMVSKVYENTAAEKAGLRAADVIVKAGNKEIKTNGDLRGVLSELEDDEAVDIEVYRKGKALKINVVPDKDKNLNIWFDRFVDTMKDIKVRIDDEKGYKEAAEKYRKAVENLKNRRQKNLQESELEKYKKEVEKMRREQEKMKKEMEKLKQLLEKKKK